MKVPKGHNQIATETSVLFVGLESLAASEIHWISKYQVICNEIPGNTQIPFLFWANNHLIYEGVCSIGFVFYTDYGSFF